MKHASGGVLTATLSCTLLDMAVPLTLCLCTSRNEQTDPIARLMLARAPDDLPPEVYKIPANIDQMRKLFEGWDPVYDSVLHQLGHDS